MPILLGAYLQDPRCSTLDQWKQQRGTYPPITLDYLNWPRIGHYAAYPNPDYAADNFSDYPPSTTAAPTIRGSLIYLKWQPCGVDALGSDSFNATWEPYGLTHIVAGEFDTWITGFAKALAAARTHVLITFGHEMNGGWYPWGFGKGGNPANTPALFAQAWQHVWTIFQKVGANQFASWVWDVNVSSRDDPSYAAAYPGDPYVDWIGWDGYNEANVPFTQFRDLFSADYATLTALSKTKPLLVAETGCRSRTTNPPDPVHAQADWLAQLLEVGGYTGTGLSLFPRVHALIYWDKDGGSFGDFRLSAGQGSVAVWQQAALDPRYYGSFPPDLSRIKAP